MVENDILPLFLMIYLEPNRVVSLEGLYKYSRVLH